MPVCVLNLCLVETLKVTHPRASLFHVSLACIHACCSRFQQSTMYSCAPVVKRDSCVACVPLRFARDARPGYISRGGGAGGSELQFYGGGEGGGLVTELKTQNMLHGVKPHEYEPPHARLWRPQGPKSCMRALATPGSQHNSSTPINPCGSRGTLLIAQDRAKLKARGHVFWICRIFAHACREDTNYSQRGFVS